MLPSNGRAQSPLSGTPAPKQAIRVENGRVFLDVSRAPLTDVLQRLAELTGIRFDTGPDLAETVTVRIQGVTVDQVLKSLIANRALVYAFNPVDNSYKIIAAGAFASGKKEALHLNKTDPVFANGRVLAGAAAIPAGAGTTRKLKNEATRTVPLDSQGRPLYLAGEILVRFKAQATKVQIAGLHTTRGNHVLGRVPKFHLERVRLKEGVGEQNAIDAYLASGLVKIAHRHSLRYPSASPNDPDFPDQWGLENMQVPSAWEFATGSAAVVVAVIDTGINYLHPDLAANIWTNPGEIAGNGVDDDSNGYVDDIRGWDFAGGSEADTTDADADPLDVDTHGTHVAGIIGARGNNGIGVAGTAWEVRLMPLKVQPDDSESMASMDIIAAIAYAIENGAKIVNCSFGGEVLDEAELQAFTSLRDAGILAVCAAGNSSQDTDFYPNYPSNYDLENIISVAAGEESDALAGFSNFGVSTVDLMAPGFEIRSTAYDTDASVVADTAIYNADGMSYAGSTSEAGTTGRLYDCGKGYPGEFPAGVNGQVALVERGKCDGCADFTFREKVLHAQAAGAAAVIIYNNEPGLFGGTLATAGNWPPVVSVSDTDGALLLSVASLGQAVTVKNVASLYGLKQGTSMAAPFVTGVAGLLLSRNPGLSYSQMKTAILSNVVKVPALSGKVLTGGKLNARFALCSAGTASGDVSCNNSIGIEDAITALQVFSRVATDLCPTCTPSGMDVNGDARIGLEEVGYILQKISGLRGE